MIADKTKRLVWLHFFLLVFSIGFVYANTLGNQFVWDDQSLILDQSLIKNTGNFWKLFLTDLHRIGDNQANFYRPLQQLTFVFDFTFWQYNAFGFHLTNIFLHVLSSISVYLLAFCLLRGKSVAFFIALFWAVHPMHSEAVAYISGRAEMLFVFFINISFVLYLQFEKNHQKFKYGLALICFVLGLLSKEAALILPFILLCYVLLCSDMHNEQGKISLKLVLDKLKWLSVFFAILAVYVILRTTVLDFSGGGSTGFVLSLTTRLLTAVKVVVLYLQLLIFPLNLHMERLVTPLASFFSLEVLVFVWIVAGFIYSIKRLKGDNAVFWFGILFFMITLLPVLNIIVPVNALLAEHWLYYPSIGLFLSGGFLFSRLYGKHKRLVAFSLIILTLLFTWYAYLTYLRNQVWQNNISLYSDILLYNQSSARVLNNLGTAYARQGKLKEALIYYKKALAIKPDFADALNNTGIVYKNLGKYEKALQMYEKVVRSNPEYKTVYHNLGVIYQIKGQYSQAIAAFKEGIKLNPYYAETYVNLANVYINMGMYNLAYEECETALGLNKYHDGVYNALGVILLKQGNYSQASIAFSNALKINPNNATAVENLKIVKNKLLKELND